MYFTCSKIGCFYGEAVCWARNFMCNELCLQGPVIYSRQCSESFCFQNYKLISLCSQNLIGWESWYTALELCYSMNQGLLVIFFFFCRLHRCANRWHQVINLWTKRDSLKVCNWITHWTDSYKLFEMHWRCADRSVYDINFTVRAIQKLFKRSCGTFMSYASWSAWRRCISNQPIVFMQISSVRDLFMKRISLLKKNTNSFRSGTSDSPYEWVIELITKYCCLEMWRSMFFCCCFCHCLELFSFRTVDNIILSWKCKFLNNNLIILFIQL